MNAHNPNQASQAAEIAVDRRDISVKTLLQPLQSFLDKEGTNEVAINKPFEAWVLNSGGWTHHHVPELTFEKVNALSRAICARDSAGYNTFNSVKLPTGERVQICQAPATLEGHVAMAIRVASAVVKTLEQLAEEGAFDQVRDVSFNKPSEEEVSRLLEATDMNRLEPFEAELLKLKRERRWVEFLTEIILAERNILIGGGTGSGKTTFARSLIAKVPKDQRIVTFEDVHELKLPDHPNKVHLFYGDGPGRESSKECLRAAMRLTPDRIFPAELRGDEAWEYLNSLNTGHPGSLTTIHGNSAVELFGRVFSLVKGSKAGLGLDADYIRSEIYKTVHVCLFFKKRKMTELFYDPIYRNSKLV